MKNSEESENKPVSPSAQIHSSEESDNQPVDNITELMTSPQGKKRQFLVECNYCSGAGHSSEDCKVIKVDVATSPIDYAEGVAKDTAEDKAKDNAEDNADDDLHVDKDASPRVVEGVPLSIVEDEGRPQKKLKYKETTIENESTPVPSQTDSAFSVNGKNDFKAIRCDSRYLYFDRTQYITVLESFPQYLVLFLRPRRFGKSLAISMLSFFHGVQYKDLYNELFEGLAVDKDVQRGKVTPHKYLILSFDFSVIEEDPDANAVTVSLHNMVNESIINFYRDYASYLMVESVDDLINGLISQNNAIVSLTNCVGLVAQILLEVPEGDDADVLAGVKGIYCFVDEYDTFGIKFQNSKARDTWNALHRVGDAFLRAFLETVRNLKGSRRISKCYITGVLPIKWRGFKNASIASNVSSHEQLSGFCGLRRDEVLSTLRLPNVCSSEAEVQEHFTTMIRYINGYRFSRSTKAHSVFNTNTCLKYLNGLLEKHPIHPDGVSNSEAAEILLEMTTTSPIAINILEIVTGHCLTLNVDNWRTPVPYSTLPSEFSFADLIKTDQTKEVWLSFMRYIGGLTYANEKPMEQLEIPNLIAYRHFAQAILSRYRLHREDIEGALQDIA